jgi:hypothetical protein
MKTLTNSFRIKDTADPPSGRGDTMDPVVCKGIVEGGFVGERGTVGGGGDSGFGR